MNPIENPTLADTLTVYDLSIFVIVLIGGLALLAIGMVLWNILRAYREKKYLAQVQERFEEATAQGMATDQLVAYIQKDLPACIIKKRIELLYKIRQIHSISADLLGRLDRLEETSNYRFVRFVSNILLILGLLGTVVGLTLAVQGIIPAIEDAQRLSDIQFLTEAMADTMGGLKVAFYTTLAALGATFLLSVVLVVGQRREASFHHALETFLTYHLIPRILISTEVEASTRYVEAIERSAQDIAEASGVLDRSRDGIQTIVDSLVRATTTTENRIEDLHNFAQEFNNSVNRLAGYGQDIDQVYKEIQQVLREIQDNQVTKKLISELVNTSISKAMDAVQESAQEVRRAFQEDVKEVARAQQKFIAAVDGTSQAIKTFSNQSAESLAQVVNQGMTSALGDFSKAVMQAEERGNIARMIAGEATEHFRAFAESNSQARDHLDQRLGKALDEFSAYAENRNQVDEQLGQTLGAFKDFVENVSKHQQETHEAFRELVAASRNHEPSEEGEHKGGRRKRGRGRRQKNTAETSAASASPEQTEPVSTPG